MFRWLLSILLFCMCQISFATQLIGNLNKPDGTGFTGTLYLAIAAQSGVRSGLCGGPMLLVPTTQIAVTVTNGTMVNPPNVVGGQCTLPESMPYYAVLRDTNGNTMFSTMWLITGDTQDVGTVYAGPVPIPPTAINVIYGLGSPDDNGLNPCSAQTWYVQQDAPHGKNTWACINNVFIQQGQVAITIGDISALGTLPNDISGNAATASAFNHDPSNCGGGLNVAVGILANGNAECTTIPTPATVPNNTNMLAGNGSGGITDTGFTADDVARLSRNNPAFTYPLATNGGLVVMNGTPGWYMGLAGNDFAIGSPGQNILNISTSVLAGGNKNLTLSSARIKATNMYFDTNVGYQYNDAAPSGHTLCGNGSYYVDCATSSTDVWFRFNTCTIAERGNTYNCEGSYNSAPFPLDTSNIDMVCTPMTPGPVVGAFSLENNSLSSTGFSYRWFQAMGNGTSGAPVGATMMCVIHKIT